jgi:uncharacterized protein (TIGR00725 family)
MTPELGISADGAALIGGLPLDVASWTRRSGNQVPVAGGPVTARDLIEHLGRNSSLRHLVIGVIGPREATPAQLAAAERIGESLGCLDLTVICGGRTGVMEAVSKGCSAAGGLMIGLLPGSTPEEANPFVGVPLPTGLGEARNMIIAKSARVLIAVGGSYGTLSEVAYGLHFAKPVIGVEDAPKVDGVVHVESPDQAVTLALEALIYSAQQVEHNENV